MKFDLLGPGEDKGLPERRLVLGNRRPRIKEIGRKMKSFRVDVPVGED